MNLYQGAKSDLKHKVWHWLSRMLIVAFAVFSGYFLIEGVYPYIVFNTDTRIDEFAVSGVGFIIFNIGYFIAYNIIRALNEYKNEVSYQVFPKWMITLFLIILFFETLISSLSIVYLVDTNLWFMVMFIFLPISNIIVFVKEIKYLNYCT